MIRVCREKKPTKEQEKDQLESRRNMRRLQLTEANTVVYQCCIRIGKEHRWNK